jgi:hypothetical protein
MRSKTWAAALLSMAVISSPLSAFNGQRKGFILGIGFGAGALDYKAPSLSFSLSEATFENNLKIGYAPSNSFEIYYVNIVSYFESGGLAFANGGAFLAMTKYLKPEGKGLFLCGGIGFGYFWEMDRDSIDDSGFGAFGGIGHDIGKHWCVQAELLYTGFENNARCWGFRVTLNTLAF